MSCVLCVYIMECGGKCGVVGVVQCLCVQLCVNTQKGNWGGDGLKWKKYSGVLLYIDILLKIEL